MTWGEVKFADHIRELQGGRNDLPPQPWVKIWNSYKNINLELIYLELPLSWTLYQPSFIRQHLLHHDVQRTVLGESPYIHADLML